jgi:hypothetical protein
LEDEKEAVYIAAAATDGPLRPQGRQERIDTMGRTNGVAALVAGLPLIVAVATGITAARAASPTGANLGSAAPDSTRAEGWATRLEAIQPHCLQNQTWLGAPAAEAARTCSCTIREIVSRSTDRQLELLLILSNVAVPGARPATAQDLLGIRTHADQLARPISRICGARVDEPASRPPSLDDLAGDLPMSRPAT